ncbi:MAG: DUF4186 domain-containing protein [bacterium]
MTIQDSARLDSLFEALQKSEFRQKFRLGRQDFLALKSGGVPVALRHAAAFIEERLAPANPAKDGMQTPMKGHPVFVAQHATATCCRRCLLSWHQIESGRPLVQAEKDYVVAVLKRWLETELEKNRTPDDPGQLTLLEI